MVLSMKSLNRLENAVKTAIISLNFLFLLGCEVNLDVSVLGKPLIESREKVDSAKKSECLYRYRVGDKADVALCSYMKLSNAHVAEITDQFEISKALYREFISDKGRKIPKKTKKVPTIYISPLETLNDAERFPMKPENAVVVGWYIGRNSRIYITEAVFAEVGSVDLPHEIAHWLNHVSGISDRALDEKLASEFEEYYLNHKF